MQQTYRLVEVGRETSGDPAKFRLELAPYWSITVAYVLYATGVDLSSRIVQAQGGAKLSAGTHWDGAAVDLRTRGLTRTQILAVVAALRELGWAAWYREGGSWVGNEHIHAAANLGMTLTTGCLYQVRAYKAGYTGLGAQGRGGLDPHPRPDTIRTIADGARWAAAQIQSEEDDIMAMTPAERAQLVAEIADASRAALLGQLMTGPGINPDTKPTLHDYLVQLPQRTSSAVHGQWLGSSGPAIGTALQGTYHGVQALAVRVEALIALLEQAGPGADVATMQRIADEAVDAYAARLAAAVETA